MEEKREFASFAIEDGVTATASSASGNATRRGTWPQNQTPQLSTLRKASVASIEQLANGGVASFALATRAEAETGLGEINRKGLTFNEAVLTMIINCVGAGCVLFPKILADVGMVVGPIVCIVCAVTCHQCGVMICTACRIAEEATKTQIQTYEALAAFALPSLKYPLLITKNFAMMGFVIAYVQLVVDSIATFFPGDQPECKPSSLIRFGIVMPFFCFLAMITSLKQLARFTTVGIIAVVIECTCIIAGGIYIMIDKEQHLAAPHYDTLPKYPNSTVATTSEQFVHVMGNVGKYMAIFLFSYAVLATVPSLRSQLQEPLMMHAVLSRSFTLLIAINLVVMFFGYAGFGENSAENVIAGSDGHPGIADDLPAVGKIASVAIIVNILTSSPLYIFVMVTVFESFGDSAVFQPLTPANIGVRVGFIIALIFMGWMLPYVTEIISLVSAVFAVCNNILYPAIFHFYARKKMGILPKNPTTRSLKYWISVIIGLLVMVFGFKGAMESLLSKLESAAAAGPVVCSSAATE